MTEVIEIHPYDFAELLTTPISPMKLLDSFKQREDGLLEFDGKLYHRTSSAPRTPGPHTIF